MNNNSFVMGTSSMISTSGHSKKGGNNSNSGLFNSNSLKNLLGLDSSKKPSDKRKDQGKSLQLSNEIIQSILKEEHVLSKKATIRTKRKKIQAKQLSQQAPPKIAKAKNGYDQARLRRMAANNIFNFAIGLGMDRDDTYYLDRQFNKIQKIINHTEGKLRNGYEQLVSDSSGNMTLDDASLLLAFAALECDSNSFNNVCERARQYLLNKNNNKNNINNNISPSTSPNKMDTNNIDNDLDMSVDIIMHFETWLSGQMSVLIQRLMTCVLAERRGIVAPSYLDNHSIKSMTAIKSDNDVGGGFSQTLDFGSSTGGGNQMDSMVRSKSQPGINESGKRLIKNISNSSNNIPKLDLPPVRAKQVQQKLNKRKLMSKLGFDESLGRSTPRCLKLSEEKTKISYYDNGGRGMVAAVEALRKELKVAQEGVVQLDSMVDENIAWVSSNCDMSVSRFSVNARTKERCQKMAAGTINNVFSGYLETTYAWAFKQWKNAGMYAYISNMSVVFSKSKSLEGLSHVLYDVVCRQLIKGWAPWMKAVIATKRAEKEAAIMEIQRIIRGFLGRHYARRVILGMSAIIMQGLIRRFKARKVVNKQRIYRRKLRVHQAAKFIQKIFSKIRDIKKAKRYVHKIREIKSITRVQKICRGILGRIRYKICKAKAIEDQIAFDELQKANERAAAIRAEEVLRDIEEKKRLLAEKNKLPDHIIKLNAARAKTPEEKKRKLEEAKQRKDEEERKRLEAQKLAEEESEKLRLEKLAIEEEAAKNARLAATRSDEENEKARLIQEARIKEAVDREAAAKLEAEAELIRQQNLITEEDIRKQEEEEQLRLLELESPPGQIQRENSGFTVDSTTSSFDGLNDEEKAALKLQRIARGGISRRMTAEKLEIRKNNKLRMKGLAGPTVSPRAKIDQALKMNEEEIARKKKEEQQEAKELELKQNQEEEEKSKNDEEVEEEGDDYNDYDNDDKDNIVNDEKEFPPENTEDNEMSLEELKIAAKAKQEEADRIAEEKIKSELEAKEKDDKIAEMEAKLAALMAKPPERPMSARVKDMKEDIFASLGSTLTKVKKFTSPKKKKKPQGPLPSKEVAVQMIQGIARMRRSRVRVDKRRTLEQAKQKKCGELVLWAVVTIQCMIRGKQHRRKAIGIIHNYNLYRIKKRDGGVIKIQTMCRGYLGRKKMIRHRAHVIAERKLAEFNKYSAQKDQPKRKVKKERIKKKKTSGDEADDEDESDEEMTALDEKMEKLLEIEASIIEREKKMTEANKIAEERAQQIESTLAQMELRSKREQADAIARQEQVNTVAGPIASSRSLGPNSGRKSARKSSRSHDGPPTARSARGKDGIPADAPSIMYNGEQWVQLWDPDESCEYWYCPKTEAAEWYEPGKEYSEGYETDGAMTDYSTDHYSSGGEYSEYENDTEWQEFWDDSAQAKYWYNSYTGEATWTKPDSNAASVNTTANRSGNNTARAGDPADWISYIDDTTGQEYWYNAKTGESSWV
jgi:hypothetical protein